MLTQEELKSLVIYDTLTGVFTNKVKRATTAHVGCVTGNKTTSGYVQLCISGKLYAAHRLAWLYVHGVLPTNELDHINNKRDDNRICNLRPATRSQNIHNAQTKLGISGVKGVSWDKIARKWYARVSLAGITQRKHFASLDEATAWVVVTRAQLHEGFANDGTTNKRVVS